MRSDRFRTVLAALAALTLLASACGSDDDAIESDPTQNDGEPATIVVTTNVLGDVVEDVVGDQAEVVTIMPVGADPHDFQPSAQEVDALVSADALIVNGAGFEEGLLDVIESARDEGVPTYEAIDAVATIAFGEDSHSEEHGDEEEHADDDEHTDEEDSEDEQGRDHEGADPHFFTDPMRMAAATDGIVAFLSAEVDGIDAPALDASADAYVAELDALDTEVTSLVDAVPAERRVLVTNHEVFGYFADRYGFEVVGVVIPGGSTTDAASAGELAELAEVIEAEGVPAIFADTSSPDELVTTLADEVGDIEVVELYSESLGEPGSDGATYLGMVQTNAERISAALA